MVMWVSFILIEGGNLPPSSCNICDKNLRGRKEIFKLNVCKYI